ncbi:lysophospholipid acyltransferase family protein [Psittacicella hinzii]|uniref:1-acyl-sn-glycerol-3-phosphate acyltransferase n=1 Tax=Psittacicella hinzii TaxID=2028575 RepID=A0A3A1YS18_9GAMM|nr:1-acyl-sn-glycerol-3-phosphate acyltransferase [Psittacicella hinzii]RIY39720.1 1-acyl-sn-glycerol-3-phosphate acyltransferase [Psittacicella hinzii]
MGKKIELIYRFIVTIFGFILFGVFGTLMYLVLIPWGWNYPNTSLKSQLKARKFVSWTWRLLIKYGTLCKIVKVNYRGLERLGKPGQLILANHPSLLDVVLLFMKINNTNIVVKKSLLQNPSMRGAIRACGFIPGTESEEFLEACHKALQEQSLLIFPEGTRTGWDGVVNIHRGAISIGLRSAKVITPVIIKANPPHFKKGQPWYKVPVCTVNYDIYVGEDIDTAQRLAEKPLPIAARRIKAELETYFNTQTKDNTCN